MCAFNSTFSKIKQVLDYVGTDKQLFGTQSATSPISGPFPRIALVKQEVYADLYCCDPGQDAKTILLSSVLRSGFVGLFTRMQADFMILKLDPAPECQVWAEMSTDCNGPSPETLLSFRDKVNADSVYHHTKPQGAYAVSADDVDWSRYDIVISLNVSVPARITRQFPGTVWAYCIGEPCMNTYKSSHHKLVAGYDLFLNQKFRRRPFDNATHELDFPYYLQYYGCFHELLGLKEEEIQKKGVILEKHSVKHMKEADLKRFESIGPVYFQQGTTEEMLRTIVQAKYYYRLQGPNRWGNAMVESAAAGCLFFGSIWEFYNRVLFSDFTYIRTMDQFFNKVDLLENNAQKYGQELDYIKNTVTEYCFNRPVTQLIQKAEKIKHAKRA